MKDLICASCGQSIGLDRESKDDRYWFVEGHCNEDEIFCCKQETAYWYGFRDAKQAEKTLKIQFAYASDFYQDQADQEEYEARQIQRNRDGYVDSHYLDPRGVYVGY